jgi:hypothetical protein
MEGTTGARPRPPRGSPHGGYATGNAYARVKRRPSVGDAASSSVSFFTWGS